VEERRALRVPRAVSGEAYPLAVSIECSAIDRAGGSASRRVTRR
jgi:hypothetical protein